MRLPVLKKGRVQMPKEVAGLCTFRPFGQAPSGW